MPMTAEELLAEHEAGRLTLEEYQNALAAIAARLPDVKIVIAVEQTLQGENREDEAIPSSLDVKTSRFRNAGLQSEGPRAAPTRLANGIKNLGLASPGTFLDVETRLPPGRRR